MLAQAFSSGDWDDVNRALDENFYFYLFTDPDLLDRVFAAAPPDWYERHPRNVMSRAIATAASRPVVLIDDHARERFAAWVGSQRQPAARDVLELRQAGIRGLLAAGRYSEAADEAERVLELIRTAENMEGFHDVLPPVLLQCGTAKLLVADVDDAIGIFSEALRWATIRSEHPSATFARAHLALAYALSERYRQARELLDADHGEAHGPGDARFHYEEPGLLARGLIAAVASEGGATADVREPDAVTRGNWWWVPVHTRAIAALLWGSRWEAIHEISHVLLVQRARSAPRSLAGAVLRSDLATLYQSVGDLRHAERVLNTPGMNAHWSGGRLALARQAWLLGNPADALTMLREDESATGIPLTHHAGRAVIFAEAERGASGTITPHTAEFVASAVDATESRISITQASPALRAALEPLLKTSIESIPVRFTARSAPRLTRREREVLDGLAGDLSVTELAHALHVSPNTVKSHLRGLYRKLGAHNREEALWLARRTE